MTLAEFDPLTNEARYRDELVAWCERRGYALTRWELAATGGVLAEIRLPDGKTARKTLKSFVPGFAFNEHGTPIRAIELFYYEYRKRVCAPRPH